MKVSLRGHLLDLLAFRGLTKKRMKRFAKASAAPLPLPTVNELAAELHPYNLELIICDVKGETNSSKTFRLRPAQAGDPLPYFRAGQYLSLKADVNGTTITRPYSISSAPYESLGPDGYYEITIRQVPDGFLTPHIWAQWGPGTEIQSSGPLGTFYHEPLRDAPKIVGLAGGSGITPFRSMAREIVHGDLEAELLLLYGSSAEDDILCYDELEALAREAPGKLRVVHVLSCEEVSLPGCEQGFITADIMERYADVENASFFLCGPQVMYPFVEGELTKLGIPSRRIRREVYGQVKDVSAYPGFPQDLAGQSFQMWVEMGGEVKEIPAAASETLLVAMERAKLAPPSQCRSGECGFCRSRLVSGDVFVLPDGDGRRLADKEIGYIHPCASYPLSDLEIAVPRSA